jgi:hypothetical protein
MLGVRDKAVMAGATQVAQDPGVAPVAKFPQEFLSGPDQRIPRRWQARALPELPAAGALRLLPQVRARMRR